MSAIHLQFGKATLAAAAFVYGCLGAPEDAHATLGGDVASVAANQERLGGVRHVEMLATGERHEIELPSGIVVREYVSPSGAVYAITWRGPRMPDLRELLGPYFAELSSRDARGGNHRMILTRADLVVRSTGHRNSFTGRAWVPSLVPAGLNIDTALE